jgi:hypothetical protein
MLSKKLGYEWQAKQWEGWVGEGRVVGMYIDMDDEHERK